MSSLLSHSKPKVARGPAFARPRGQVSVANTIPTNSMTILHERDMPRGFGTSSERFDTYLKDTDFTPGPGAYKNLPGSLTTADKSKAHALALPGVGFKSRPANPLAKFKNTGPGPGSYDTTKDLGRQAQHKSGHNTSTFLFGRSKSHVAVRREASPPPSLGPGSYDVQLPAKSVNPGVLMKSSVGRMGMPKPASYGIGFYEVGGDLSQHKSYQTPENTSSFAVPVKGSLQKVKITDYSKIRKLIQVKPTEKIEVRSLWASGSIPGPGAYDDAHAYHFLQDYKPISTKGVAGFASNKPRDQMASKQRSPEPGAYNIKSAFDSERYQLFNSVFLSTTKRLQDPLPPNEGLGPEDVSFRPAHKSHNKNPHKNWV